VNVKVLIVTAFAVVIACWGAWTYTTTDVAEVPPPGDRVLAAVNGLKSSHVYVDPDSAGILTPAEVTRIDTAAASSEPEVFVVIWRESTEAGYYLPRQALGQIGAELDRPGFYISAGAKEIASDEVGIKSDDYISSYGSVEFDDGLAPGELAEGVLSLIDENDGREFSVGNTTGSHYWGGTGEMIFVGALIGSLAGAGLTLILVIGWFTARGRRTS
jgi:hypothetical protein